MIEEHAAAVLALLRAFVGPPPLLVLDGVNHNPATSKSWPPPYLLTYFDAGNPDLSFVGRSHTFQLGITCHSVGVTARAARLVADNTRTALLDVTPTVAGRKCYPIRWDSGVPPQRDESTGSTVFDQVDIYVLRSVPA